MKVYLFILVLLFFACNHKPDEYQIELLRNQVRKEIMDSISKADYSKALLYTYKVTKKKSVLIYDNHTWEYNEKKSEPLPLGLSSVPLNATGDKKGEKQNKLKVAKPESKSVSSGYCGHRTKSGGSCTRRVKGGGFCWQHS